MSLARWDPFLELKTFENEMNRLLRRPRPGASHPEDTLIGSQFAPPVDIYEDDTKLSIKMDVPGIDANDLDIRVDGNVVTVSGERKLESEEKKENFRRVEREYGAFSRSFTLPASADTDNVNANFENGTLRIGVPKRANSRGKHIRLNESSASPERKKAA
jgi:HSP20 family protein